ncbi:hypothetical protein [Aurantimonas sp. HBX-1]|uniref:hypothetical protein n=1 Tax=Aurantimonas sp. HBX-1 TaxID=2906072 RepID=UPI001F2929BE|nr:hypothetical protein [Aurantimonas sp. HBX-1]UIJ70867.1 hypothetical protein LXB15_14125 [Aurantimonas sp. HBX-1]
MTLERFLSAVAFVVLCVFLLVLVTKVATLDLTIVVLVTVLLCGYDLFFHRVPPHP